MRTYQQDVIHLLQEKDSSKSEADLAQFWKFLSPQDAARLFIDLSFLITAFTFVQEQYWIFNREKSEPGLFGNYIKRFFKKELKPVLFMHATLETVEVIEVEEMRQQAIFLQKTVIQYLKIQKNFDLPLFTSTCLRLMSEYYEFELQIHNKNEELNNATGISLDRTFDILDDVFEIKYKLGGQAIATNERIYEGSGIGVQSSYSTILLALRYLKIPHKARLIDLGSGYGRVGFVIGLMRPDIQFKGYEFVDYRVAMTKSISEKFKMADRVKFFHQDLSEQQFNIPEAEVYYLFDPFTDSTYEHVIRQLNDIGAKKPIVIITKGNAREHFMTAIQRKHWSPPQVFYQGNFCLFRSHGRHGQIF